MAGYGFDERGTRRIARTVRTVEQHPQNFGRTPSDSSTSTPEFWARLTAESTASPGQYKWTKIHRRGNTWVDAPDPQNSGDDFSAHDPNLTTGLPVGADGVGARVRLQFLGYDDASKPVYVIVTGPVDEDLGEFQWQQPVMGSANQKTWGFNRVHGLLNND